MKDLNLSSAVINQKTLKPKKTQPDNTKDTKTEQIFEKKDVNLDYNGKKNQPQDSLKSSEKSQNPEKSSFIKSIFKKIVSIPTRFFKWYAQLNLLKKVIYSGLFLAIFGSTTALILYKVILPSLNLKDLEIPDIMAAEESDKTYTNITIPDPNPPREAENPINGELYTKSEWKIIEQKYPIAVMIENHTDARPQSGYNSADIVYETLAEGGITRTMAVFWGRSCDEIGPIRSARQYFIEWMVPYDAIYMHIGYASSDDPRVDSGGTIYNLGIKSMDKYGTFWRSSEKYAPHNAYTSTELLYEKAEYYGYTGTPSKIEPYLFKKDESVGNRGEGRDVTVSFFDRLSNYGLYDITWKYEKERNVYLRYNGDTPYIDQNTGEQVYAKTVVLERNEMISTYDEKAHVIITTIGSGDAIILSDGKIINCTWKKDDINSRTRYYTPDGNEYKFNRGIIWVVGVPEEQGNVVVAE
ncbi:DUF3048 domain-containing protein [Candidatus Dojkabacteria bacterium]|nr:DUF3048 domain-containing protein [Candidatus Dojkabacteria bacterium]